MPNILLALEWYDHRIHRGVARVAARYGWHLTCPSGQPGFQPVPEGWRGDGAITLLGDRWMGRLLRRRVPLVDIGLTATARVPHTVVDNAAAAALAHAHLRSRGWRRFACLSSPGVAMFDERSDAFVARLAAEGLPCPLWTTAGLAKRLRQAAPLALFAVQDALGADAIAAALGAGLRVPEDVAIMGVDDCDLICEALPVPLASVDTDQDGLGVAAAERLARILAGRPDDGAMLRHPPRAVLARPSAEAYGTTHAGLRTALDLARRQPACGVRALAGAAGLSAQGLDLVCRRELGVNPGTMLRRLRLDGARRLLDDGRPVRAVAEALGLASASGLCALIRRETGQTPRRWRASASATTASSRLRPRPRPVRPGRR
jgi:LacI family transcriptional regulator